MYFTDGRTRRPQHDDANACRPKKGKFRGGEFSEADDEEGGFDKPTPGAGARCGPDFFLFRRADGKAAQLPLRPKSVASSHASSSTRGRERHRKSEQFAV